MVLTSRSERKMMPAMRKKQRDVAQACLYVSLPDGSVPKGILDGKLAIERIELNLILSGGSRHRVSVGRAPCLRLYALNRPLEEIRAQQEDMVRELLDLRSRLMLMALRLGLKGRVPSSRNGLTWLQLADLIRARLVQLQSRVKAIHDPNPGTFAAVGECLSDEALASMVRSKKGN